MGPRVPFAPALLTLSLHITLHINFISSRLFLLLYVTCVMVNKAVKKNVEVCWCGHDKARCTVSFLYFSGVSYFTIRS